MVDHWCHRWGFLEADAEMQFSTRCKLGTNCEKEKIGSRSGQRKELYWKGTASAAHESHQATSHNGQTFTLLLHSECKLLWEECDLRQRRSLKLRQFYGQNN